MHALYGLAQCSGLDNSTVSIVIMVLVIVQMSSVFIVHD